MIENIRGIFNDIICQLSHWKNIQQFEEIQNRNDDEYSLSGFNELKCIYIHIPKAAGISINKALFGNYGGGHETIRFYKKVFGLRLFHQYYKFTFVRNPYSRLFSAYTFLKAGGFNETDQQWASNNLYNYESFDEFIKNWLSEENIWNYVHFKPQYSFICDVRSEPEVDFIGKVENIDADFEDVCRSLGIDKDLSIKNRSKTGGASWLKNCSDQSREKIAEVYSEDFRMFNYSK